MHDISRRGEGAPPTARTAARPASSRIPSGPKPVPAAARPDSRDSGLRPGARSGTSSSVLPTHRSSLSRRTPSLDGPSSEGSYGYDGRIARPPSAKRGEGPATPRDGVAVRPRLPSDVVRNPPRPVTAVAVRPATATAATRARSRPGVDGVRASDSSSRPGSSSVFGSVASCPASSRRRDATDGRSAARAAAGSAPGADAQGAPGGAATPRAGGGVAAATAQAAAPALRFSSRVPSPSGDGVSGGIESAADYVSQTGRMRPGSSAAQGLAPAPLQPVAPAQSSTPLVVATRTAIGQEGQRASPTGSASPSAHQSMSLRPLQMTRALRASARPASAAAALARRPPRPPSDPVPSSAGRLSRPATTAATPADARSDCGDGEDEAGGAANRPISAPAAALAPRPRLVHHPAGPDAWPTPVADSHLPEGWLREALRAAAVGHREAELRCDAQRGGVA